MYHFTKLNVYFSSILLQKEDKTWQLSTGNVATLLADFHVEKEIVRKETELAILEFYLGEIQQGLPSPIHPRFIVVGNLYRVASN